MSQQPSTTTTRPVWLVAAAGLAVLEGSVFCAATVLELASTASDRLGLALTTAAFFLVLGIGLLVCGWGLWRVRSWARSPLVVVQLIILLTAWSLYRGDEPRVAGAMAVVSVATLVCVLHPRAIEALAADAG